MRTKTLAKLSIPLTAIEFGFIVAYNVTQPWDRFPNLEYISWATLCLNALGLPSLLCIGYFIRFMTEIVLSSSKTLSIADVWAEVEDGLNFCWESYFKQIVVSDSTRHTKNDRKALFRVSMMLQVVLQSIPQIGIQLINNGASYSVFRFGCLLASVLQVVLAGIVYTVTDRYLL